MARQTITREKYERFLSLAPTTLLEQVGNNLIAEADKLPEGFPDLEVLGAMFVLLGMEYQLRQVEPLWRKAQRFAIRNSGTIVKVAACIGAGVILGASAGLILGASMGDQKVHA